MAPGRTRKGKESGSSLNGWSRVSLVGTCASLAWVALPGGSVLGAPGRFLPLMWMLLLAGGAALLGRSGPNRRLTRGESHPRVLSFLPLLLYLVLVPIAQNDPFSRSLAVLGGVSAVVTGALGFHLSQRSSGVRRWFRWTSMVLLFVELGLVLTQGWGGSGSFSSPSHLAGFTSLALLIGLERGEEVRPDRKADAQHAENLLVGMGLLLVFLGASPSGILTLSLALLFREYLRVPGKKRVRRLFFLLLAGSAGLLLLVASLGWIVLPGDMEATVGRRAGILAWGSSPLIGLGPGHFWVHAPRWRILPEVDPGCVVPHDGLHLLAEGGLVGLLLAVLGLGGLLRSLYQAKRKTPEGEAASSVGLLAWGSLLVGGLFGLQILVPANLFLLSLISGVELGEAARLRERRSSSPAGREPSTSDGRSRKKRRVRVERDLQGRALVLAGAVGVLWLSWGAWTWGRACLAVSASSGRTVEEGEIDLEALLRAARWNPGSLWIRRQLARGLLQAAEGSPPVRVLDLCSRARDLQRFSLEVVGETGEDLLLLGRALTGLARGSGEDQGALQVLARAATLAPLDAEVSRFQGEEALVRGHFSEAEGFLARAVDLDPRGQGTLGSFLSFLDQTPDPRPLAEKLGDRSPSGWRLLAEVLSRKGFDEEAAGAWARARSLAPLDPSIRAGRGLFLLAWGRKQEALVDLQVAWEGLRPRSPEVLDGLVRVFQELGREPLPLLEAGVRLWPGQLRWRLARAERLVELGRTSEALQAYRRLSEDHPGSAAGPTGEGELLSRKGSELGDRRWIRQAASRLREALRREPGLAKAESALIRVYLALGDRGRAEELLLVRRKAGRLDPDQVVALARIWMEREEYQEAFDMVGRALLRYPDLVIDGRPARLWLLREFARQGGADP